MPPPEAAALRPGAGARLALALGLVIDGALLALMIGISGFIFQGPEGARGDASAVASWSAIVLGILGCAVAAIIAARRGRGDIALLLVFAPPVIGLAGLAFL